jgi:CRISPR/Cas system-associated exonuclease Cas4 (RecB family)
MDKQPAIHYDSNRVLTASEIGSYLYCNRSWWLDKVGGHQPANVEELELGQWVHEEHGYEVQRAEQIDRTANGFIIAAAGVGLLALVLIILQIAF